MFCRTKLLPFAMAVVARCLLAGQAPLPEVPNDQDAPVALAGLIRLVGRMKMGAAAITEQMLIDKINKSGISFEPTKGVRDQLAAAGASLLVLRAVESAKMVLPMPPPAPAPPPPRPPRPTYGLLNVACKPVDCEVLVNGIVAGRTENGMLPRLKYAVGIHYVKVREQDYGPDAEEKRVQIQENAVETVEFQLSLTPEGASAVAKRLLARMVAAAGGAAMLNQFVEMRATGKIWRESDGATWPFQMWFKLPATARFEILARRIKFRFFCAGDRCDWERRWTPRDLTQAGTAISLVAQFNPFRVLRDLQDGLLRPAVSVAASTTELGVLPREQRTNRLPSVILGEDYRPATIKVEGTGGSAAAVHYSDYRSYGFSNSRSSLLPSHDSSHRKRARPDRFQFRRS